MRFPLTRIRTPSLDKIERCQREMDINPTKRIILSGLTHVMPVKVKRIRDLNPEYRTDMNLLERNYTSLNQLKQKLDELNVFYKIPLQKGTLANEVYEILKSANKSQIGIPMSLYLYGDSGGSYDILDNISTEPHTMKKSKAYEVLESHGIEFLRHNIKARPYELYDNRTIPMPITMLHHIKVADILPRLL